MKFIYTILNTINTTYNPWNSTIRYPQWATNPNKVFYLIGFRSNINCSTVYICLLICGFCGQKKRWKHAKLNKSTTAKSKTDNLRPTHTHTPVRQFVGQMVSPFDTNQTESKGTTLFIVFIDIAAVKVFFSFIFLYFTLSHLFFLINSFSVFIFHFHWLTCKSFWLDEIIVVTISLYKGEKKKDRHHQPTLSKDPFPPKQLNIIPIVLFPAHCSPYCV